jgi:glutamine synthetase
MSRPNYRFDALQAAKSWQPDASTGGRKSWDLSKVFGENTFGLPEMRSTLPKGVFTKLMDTIENGAPLDPAVADAVAVAMKDWAVARGATHFTHWFQPLTGQTAEKHDSFVAV